LASGEKPQIGPGSLRRDKSTVDPFPPYLSVTARDATGAAREVQVEPQGDTALLRFDSEPAGLGLRIRALR